MTDEGRREAVERLIGERFGRALWWRRPPPNDGPSSRSYGEAEDESNTSNDPVEKDGEK